MHNCKAMRDHLLDLLLGDVNSAERAARLEELRQCTSCRDEYAGLTEMLNRVDDSLALKEPTEEFWPAYLQRLDTRLKGSLEPQSTLTRQPGEVQSPVGLLRAFFTPRVPVPVAAGLVLAAGFTVWLVMRTQQTAIVSAPPPPPIVETRTVEVPVIEERVVTKVRYVNRRRDGRGFTPVDVNKSASSLAGFRPPSQLQLTVIKRSDSNEK